MPAELFAICRPRKHMLIRRVPLNTNIKSAVGNMFARQARRFHKGKEAFVFDPGYKPERNQLQIIDETPEITALRTELQKNPDEIEELDVAGFTSAGIKGLFVRDHSDNVERIYVQRFTNMQVLDRKFALFFENNRFRRLKDSAFTLANSLVCVIENGSITFQSFHSLRAVFDLRGIYREATEEDLRQFASHSMIRVKGTENFIEEGDTETRRLVGLVLAKKVLQCNTVADLQEAAEETNLTLKVNNRGRIVIPADNKERKAILHFLANQRVMNPITKQPSIANSLRPA